MSNNNSRSSKRIISELSEIGYDPTRLQKYTLDMLAEVLDDDVAITNPSTPSILTLESNVMHTAACIQTIHLNNSRHYPNMANTENDIYDHMCDKDFVGMFAMPGKCRFTFYLSMQEIESLASPVSQGSLSKRLTMPRYTEIMANGIPFTLQYPIDFLLKSHGALELVYNTTQPSPLHVLRGNKIEWRQVNTPSIDSRRMELMEFTVEALQMQMKSYPISTNLSRVVEKEIEFRDEFYYARAFTKNKDNEWVEIKTTHSTLVFDITEPTVGLTVVGNKVKARINPEYVAIGTIGREVRLDVYTTRGEINLDMRDLTSAQFGITFRDPGLEEGNNFTHPFSQLVTMSILSSDIATGGRDAPTFDQRRQRVKDNSIGTSVIPISDAQMQIALNDIGMDSLMNLSYLTYGVYVASRPMPNHIEGQASKGIDSAVMTLRDSLERLSTYDTVEDNGDRITIKPTTLFRNDNGILRIVKDDERISMERLPAEALANRLNEANYLWTPFHYVLDTSRYHFSARPYFLDSPTLTITSFAASNDTTALTIRSSPTRTIARSENGYKLRIVTESNKTFQDLPDHQIGVQIGLRPKNEDDYAYINGVQVEKLPNGERIFEFNIDTNWDIDEDHNIHLTNPSIYEGAVGGVFTDLRQDWALFWTVNNYMVPGLEDSEIDSLLGHHLLAPNSIGVYQEALDVKLGDELTGLWTKVRAVIGERPVRRYSSDVQGVYTENKVKYKPGTNLPETKVVDGKKTVVYEYKKGELMKNKDGTPYIIHKAGDPILDKNGLPTFESERFTQRWVDLTLFDATYRYANNKRDSEYVKSVPVTMVDWINDLMSRVKDKMLHETDLFFTPQNTLKYARVVMDDGELRTIHTAQRISVDYYLAEMQFKDETLREPLRKTAKRQVLAELEKVTVSRDSIQESIRELTKGDIISVNVKGLGGYLSDTNAVTVEDDSVRLCIAKSLAVEPDGKLVVVDDIQINFKLHSRI